MTNVWQGSCAIYIGCIAAEYSYVMKHCRRGNEVFVDFETSAVDAFQSLVSHFFAVDHQRFVKLRTGLIIFTYNF